MKKENTERIERIIDRKTESLDDDIKFAVGILMDIYAEKRVITCLKLLEEEELDLE